MSKREEPAGLAQRLAAAERLQSVLAGEPFQPFLPADIPDGRNRALSNRLVTAALRRHSHLDLILADLLERGMPKKSGSFEAVLRIALTQLLFLPELGAHSAVFLAVEALKRDERARHLTGLANAVLRRAQGSALQYWDLPPRLLLPAPVRERWAEAYGEAMLASFGEALLADPPLDLTLAGEDPDLVVELGAEPLFGETVRIASRDRPVEALPGFAEGRWWVQDAAAALPARLFDLPPGAPVLDLCAAPGGKSAQLAARGYQVTALENDPARLERLRTNLERLKLPCELVLADATAPFRPGSFAGVLLDAPCSATGTFRRHPEVIWHRSIADIRARVGLQRRMLESAAGALAPGGVLVYAVCSLEHEEGEAQAAWALAQFPELVAVPVPPDAPGIPPEAITPGGFVRTHPGLLGERGGMDGFFIARFRKIPEGN